MTREQAADIIRKTLNQQTALRSDWQAALGMALDALSTPLVPEWLPIESAPMDIDVLLYADGECVVAGWFEARDDWETSDLRTVLHPTHWMPLPAPPEGK
jgi:hypothetical protein